MSGMVRAMEPTEKEQGTQEAEAPQEGPDDDLFVCTCRWQLADHGQLFSSYIAWSDPYCRVHQK